MERFSYVAWSWSLCPRCFDLRERPSEEIKTRRKRSLVNGALNSFLRFRRGCGVSPGSSHPLLFLAQNMVEKSWVETGIRVTTRNILSSRRVMAKGKLRMDEKSGLPILVITNQLQLWCHHKVEEIVDGGIVETVKVRPTAKFIDELNKRVFELLQESINNAREAGRREIQPQDVPVFMD